MSDVNTNNQEIGELESDWVDQVMEKVQEFASTWSSVGGPFDSGDTLEQANESKQELRNMLSSVDEHIQRISK